MTPLRRAIRDRLAGRGFHHGDTKVTKMINIFLFFVRFVAS
jgi:hypothetical protein